MLLRIAWRNLRRNWRRTLLVLAAIFVGLAGSLFVMAWSRGMIYQMAENAIRTRFGHVSVLARGWREDPDPSRAIPDGARPVLAALEGRRGVEAAPRLIGDGLVQSARANLAASIVGIDPEREARVSVVPHSIVEGEYLEVPGSPAPTRALPPVLIGRAAAERLGVGVGDKVVLHVPGDEGLGAFRVRGIFQTDSSEFDRSTAFLPLDAAQKLFVVVGGVTEVNVVLERPRQAQELQADLRTALAGADVEVLRWQEREPRLAAMLQMVNDVGWIMYAVVFVAMAFGIANVLLMSVFERMREFGVLRALGLRSGQLVRMVVVESCVLTAGGAILGTAAGAGLVLWVGGIDLAMFSAAMRQFGVGTVVYPRLELVDLTSPVALAVATALLAALWPAWRLARLRPSEALRRT